VFARLRKFFNQDSQAAAVAHYQRGNLLKDQAQLVLALQSYDRAVSLDPSHANAFCNRGVILQRLNRPAEALASYEKAVLLNPQDALAHYNTGVLLQAMNRPDEALARFSAAIAISPGYVAALCNRGILLQELGEFDAALNDFNRAIECDRRFAHAFFCRGTLHHHRKHLDAALADYDEAIMLDPACADAYCNRGGLLAETRKFDAALASLDSAVAISPAFAQAHSNRADTLVQIRQYVAAIASYDQAIALDPDIKFAPGMRRYARMYVCDWRNLNADVKAFSAAVEADVPVAPPLTMLALVDSPHVQFKAARSWVREKVVTHDLLPALPRREHSGKIRLGYFSGDFCNHPVAILAAGFLELHDRSRFEVTAFSYGPDTQDAMRIRLETTVDRFLDVKDKSDKDVALLSRSLGIDIAIDLGGHTGTSRTGIFALRAAPIQINYLGYPGTMAAEFIDYLIADRTVIPEDQQRHYSEKIVHLRDQFLPHDSRREIAEREFRREEFGLPATGCIFCCFNSSHKIMPDIFDIWMRILARTGDSVLWLSQNNATAGQNLMREAENRGIDARRLIFASRMPSAAEHLARHRIADLFLDTLPYNAHATALDALWSGLPVLTRIGQGFAARVGASVLKTIGLPELITSTAAQYEELAVELAANPQRLAEIRQKLERHRLTTPLFDTARFTGNLEHAYVRVFERYRAGLAPEHLHPE
jgi:predicted O-linked N-acetylglucosamine transferase (SPINDLY family)